MMAAIVRCPFCDRRYNVTGIPAGTKVLCTSCGATLAVPSMPRAGRVRPWIGAGLGALALAVALAARTQDARPEPAIEPPRADAPATARTRADELRLLASARFRFCQRAGSGFLLAGEIRPGVDLEPLFADFHDALAGLVARFESETGLGPPDDPLVIVIFTYPASFDAFRRERGVQPDACGFYETSTRRAALLYEGGGPPVATLLHEATHQLLDHHARGGALSRWFQEGTASVFESFRRTATAHVEVAPSLARAERSIAIPLRELFDDGAWERPESRAACYATAKALVAHLRGRHPAFFGEVMKTELDGRRGGDAFERLLRDRLGMTLVELEAEVAAGR
jgi:hypothetical protein